MGLPMHAGYEQIVSKARDSHERGRSSDEITADDVDLARLYSYAYRMHTIGAFHATRLAVQSLDCTDPLTKAHLVRAAETLEDLANMGMEAVTDDFRVVISTFHRYDRAVRRVTDALDQARHASGHEPVARIGERFGQIMGAISSGNGIHLTQDAEAPEQASFVVPSLGITIVPLVYGDHHSWNLAFLSEEHLDVPLHRHFEGVEIHLGYAPLEGYMVLNDCKSPVKEGYALPIPPMTRHGWANISGHVHHVPFIFGSLKQAGWGVSLDVEPQPLPLEELRTVDRTAWQMSATVFLEREVQALAKLRTSRRQTLIPASVTHRSGSGGLELSISRATEAGLAYPLDGFRILSVVNGRGLVQIGRVERPIGSRDHLGIPAGMAASIRQEGGDPFVVLDVLIK